MGDVDQESAVIVGKTERRHLPKMVKRVGLLAVLAALAVVIFGVGIGLYIHHRDSDKKAKLAAENTCTNAESGKLLGKAAANLDLNKSASLRPIVQQIKSMKTYQQDPNCLYILATYYINTGNLQNAQSSLNALNKVTGVHPLSPILTDYASVQSLKSRITNFNATVKQVQSNIIPISGPPKK